MNREIPSMDTWLQEAKAQSAAPKTGMYLVHNGVVRQTPKAAVREGAADATPVTGMVFAYDPEKVATAVADTRAMEGIFHVRLWLNEGTLQVGDDLMYVLIGGDIRPRVVAALDYLVSRLKSECVTEQELK